MRHLLLLLTLLLSPLAGAQEGYIGPTPQAGHANGGVEPAMVPAARPELVVGELTTPRFRILYTARSEGAARQLATTIESVRDTFVGVLGRDWPGVTELRVGVDRGEFEALALPGGEPPGWAVALAYPEHRIVLLNALTMAGPEGQVTLRHELAHVALGQLGKRWPRWFQEGFAQNVTGENFSMTHYTALFHAVTQEKVFHFEHLSEDWPDRPSDVELAYAQSAAFVAWLSARHGPEGMGRLVDEVATGQPFEQAFGKAFRASLLVEELDWREGLAARYGWLPLTTSTSLLWLGATGLVLAAYVRRRQQKAANLAEMEAQEAAEDAAMRAAFEAELAQQRQQQELVPLSPPPADEGTPETADTAATTEWYESSASHGPEFEDDEEAPPRPSKPTVH
ncbi:peptidase MA family metallohydrolase [Archangium lipolyticum]|uniref:peptidase MA family metallohydrolase n=1 Tax=Archangium lipolyticum TaxID=2970465 RepID=UPI00214A3775|nr:peptidase MA family metallohydrolase [Archangium lipolyticum]